MSALMLSDSSHTGQRSHWFADMFFLCLAAFYALAACNGVVALSAGGAEMDSDLSTYAFSMAGHQHPANFVQDEILREATPANSFWNLQQFLAQHLTPGDQYAVGLFRVGALAIFTFYAGAYLLGRWLFGPPGIAALLALCMGITIWVGWGDFWGIVHSDPVPRVIFSCCWLFLLMALISAMEHPWLRPPVMLTTGLAMWVHGLSALGCGAMFFTAFALHRPKGLTFSGHLLQLMLCLCCYFVPVLLFLWPSLGQSSPFSLAELDTFKELFDLRWQKDYGRLGERIMLFLDPGEVRLWILCGGFLGWLAVLAWGKPKARQLATMYPAFWLALICVTLFSWLEGLYAARVGRLPLGHELVRNLRFLIPLSWLMIVGAVAIIWPHLQGLWGRLFRMGIVTGMLFAIILFSQDRQHVAALYSLSQSTGFHLPRSLQKKVEETHQQALAHRDALDSLRRLSSPGDLVFSNTGDMGVRHLALRGLGHTFKDGSHPFYNKKPDQARTWLEYETLMRSGPLGYLEAWQRSGALWLLSTRLQDREAIARLGEIVWENQGWIIARRYREAFSTPSAAGQNSF